MTLGEANQALLWGQFFRDTRGEIFSVTFIKKDGSTRRLVGRIGVTKGVKDPGRFHAQDKKNGLMRVYDFEKQAFRTIPLTRVISATWAGRTW
jgi:hypothetical protein